MAIDMQAAGWIANVEACQLSMMIFSGRSWDIVTFEKIGKENPAKIVVNYFSRLLHICTHKYLELRSLPENTDISTRNCPTNMHVDAGMKWRKIGGCLKHVCHMFFILAVSKNRGSFTQFHGDNDQP
jgi:hypothetical protein